MLNRTPVQIPKSPRMTEAAMSPKDFQSFPWRSCDDYEIHVSLCYAFGLLQAPNHTVVFVSVVFNPDHSLVK